MKSTKFFSLILLFAIALSFASCKKDLSDNIVGEWNVTSWVEGGDEQMGDFYDKVVIEFDEPDGDKGDVSFTFTSGGVPFTQSGDYEVDVDKGEIEFSVDGISFTLNTEVDGDDLDMDGNIDGDAYRIKAERD